MPSVATVELMAAATLTSDATSPFVDVSHIDELAVHVHVTAVDAATNAVFYLVGTSDDETTQVRLPVSRRRDLDGTTPLATDAAELCSVAAGAVTPPAQAVAIYDVLPWPKVALEWMLTGATKSITGWARLAGLYRPVGAGAPGYFLRRS